MRNTAQFQAASTIRMDSSEIDLVRPEQCMTLELVDILTLSRSSLDMLMADDGEMASTLTLRLLESAGSRLMSGVNYADTHFTKGPHRATFHAGIWTWDGLSRSSSSC